MLINHKQAEEYKVSNTNPAFDQFKDRSEKEKAEIIEKAKIEIARLSLGIHNLIAPGASLYVNIKPQPTPEDKTPRIISLLITRPAVLDTIEVEMQRKAVEKPTAINVDDEQLKEEVKDVEISNPDNQ